MVAYGPRGDKPRRRAISPEILAAYEFPSGSGEIAITRPLVALIYAWGGGASGASGDGGATGSGGGAALYARVLLNTSDRIVYSIGAGGAGVAGGAGGNNGGDTQVTIPGKRTMIAGGGKASAGGRLGGVATGGDINRSGGAGGTAGSAGEAGEFGGAGGSPSGVNSGGGGSGGFSDLGSTLLDGGAGGNGSSAVAGKYPGGGTGGVVSASTSGAGGNGRLVVVLMAR